MRPTPLQRLLEREEHLHPPHAVAPCDVNVEDRAVRQAVKIPLRELLGHFHQHALSTCEMDVVIGEQQLGVEFDPHFHAAKVLVHHNLVLPALLDRRGGVAQQGKRAPHSVLDEALGHAFLVVVGGVELHRVFLHIYTYPTLGFVYRFSICR